MHDAIDYEIVGVGFGPANLALGVALEDAHFESRWIFVDHQNEFSWHPGMQLEGSTMQTPFLEDLITRRNPRSEFTFLNYVKEKGRLTDFADLRNFYPTRHEFNDYFGWAAEKLKTRVRYGVHVISISPVFANDAGVDALDILVQDTRSGRDELIRTSNVVLGLGYTPVLPTLKEPLAPDGRVFHSTTTLPSLQSRFPSYEAPYSFVVAGAGQSAAEIALHILKRYTNSRVTVVSRGFVFRSKDGNAFVSAFYTGDAADRFFELDEDARRLLLTTLDDSNFSAADGDILRELAKLCYEDKVEGRSRLELRSFSDVREIEESNAVVNITCWSQLHKRNETIQADGLCLATGYSDASLKNILKQVNGFVKRSSAGEYNVSREFRLETDADFRPGIYVQGYARDHHGCTEGTISDLPHRAHRILDSLGHRRHERHVGRTLHAAAGVGTG